MLTKIKRIISKVSGRLRTRTTIERLRAHQNTTLNRILDAIDKVGRGEYEAHDRALLQNISDYRNALQKNEDTISYAVFGSDKYKKISQICRLSTSPPKWGTLHYFLTKELRSRSYLEIGTNLGVSGSYLLAALTQNQGKLITMEGVPGLCAMARLRFNAIASTDSFEIIEGMYDNTFPELLSRPVMFDLVFIDGNHRKDPTLLYFHSLKQKITDPAVIIFDDIRWSKGMIEAWDMIKTDPDVNYCIDLHKLGIVIIDKTDRNRNVFAEFYPALIGI